MSLPEFLKSIRLVKGASLRAVEEATGISNAYLSQLERGDAQKPSPDKLHALAEFYNVPYTDLMRRAGYLQTSNMSQEGTDTHPQTSAVQAALMTASLSEEEEAAVVKYIEFLRFKSKK